MAFTNAIVGRTIVGNKRMHWGTYTNTAGFTGGDIDTGLKSCDHIELQPTGTAVDANTPTVNENLSGPINGAAVTIVTTADADGSWIAFGDSDT